MPIMKFNNYNEPGISKEILEQLQLNLLEMMFPVGSTYVTQTATNPANEEILGFGTWERVKGRVLIGIDENDTDLDLAGKTGGEKTHVLTIQEIPSHSHQYAMEGGTGTGDMDRISTLSYGDSRWYSNTSPRGGSQAHNNMPPYRVVGYVWIRTT